jgi:hypothetical protein
MVNVPCPAAYQTDYKVANSLHSYEQQKRFGADRMSPSVNADEVKYVRSLIGRTREIGQAIWLAEIHRFSVSKAGDTFHGKRYSIWDIRLEDQVAKDLTESEFVDWVIMNLVWAANPNSEK